jgi:hypothetical protein
MSTRLDTTLDLSRPTSLSVKYSRAASENTMSLWLGQLGLRCRNRRLGWPLICKSDFIRSHAVSEIKSHYCIELLFVPRCSFGRAAQIVNSLFVRLGPGWGKNYLASTAQYPCANFCEKFLGLPPKRRPIGHPLCWQFGYKRRYAERRRAASCRSKDCRICRNVATRYY